MPTDAYIGIDVGTSSVKAVVVSSQGTVLATADSPLTVTVLAPGWSEQEPEHWWSATVDAVNSIVGKLDPGVTVKSVGLSGQMHSLVALDEAQRVVRPAILWNDVRTSEQCAFIRDRVTDEKLRQMCGNPALEGFTVTKLLWVRQHEPANFMRIKQIMLAKDYVRFKMTGELATEPSDASATLLFDIRRLNWSVEMCKLLDLDPWLLPPLIQSSSTAGKIIPQAGGELNIPVGTPVVGGGADNACAAAGSGVVAPGTLLVSVGTSGTVVAPTSEPVVDSEMRIHSMAHVERDMWYLMGVVLSAGAALAWWRRSLSEGGAGAGFDELITAAGSVPAGSEGLTFLPYLTGERTPHADSAARGVFAGLNAGHTQVHMTRAVLEGVCFALRDSLELMRQLGVKTENAVAVGGGVRSETWLQILSDVLGVPLNTVGPAEGAPLGAAMLAAVGAGEFSSVAEAGEAWLSTEGRTEPNEGNSAAYEDAYMRYRSLYRSLKDWFATSAGN